MLTPDTKNTLRRIATLAWPIFIGQLAVIAYGVADTMMAARFSARDLAALSIGVSVYASIYLGLSGILQALMPLLAHAYGAKSMHEVGHKTRQGVWLGLILSTLGILILQYPDFLFDLAKASPELRAGAARYLHTISWALPAALGFTIYSALNNALARPKMVMALQVGGLMLKVLTNALFIYGWKINEHWQIPSMGAQGCALATVLVLWINLLAGFFMLKRNPFYRQFGLFGPPWSAPQWQTQRSLLRMGLPLGFAFFIEVTSFTFMAIFIARLGETALAAHQIGANIGTVMYMLPLSIAAATSSMTAQALGAKQTAQASHIAWSGVKLAGLGSGLLGLLLWLGREQVLALYTSDRQVTQIALPLFILLACYQVFDALQSTLGYVLRAYQVVLAPMLINAFALWGVGLFGGCVLGLDLFSLQPPSMISGIYGFWFSNSMSLVVLATILFFYLLRVQRRWAA